MNTYIHPEPVLSQLPDIPGMATYTARSSTEIARQSYHSAAEKAQETFAISREYIRRNPVPVLLGAVAVGASLGYLVMTCRSRSAYSERYADEPMAAVRDAIIGALAPVTHLVHTGYDSALDGAGKAMGRMHRFDSGRAVNSFSHRIARIGENLKFW